MREHEVKLDSEIGFNEYYDMYIPSKPYVTSDPIPEDWFGLMISHKSRYKSMVEEELTGANEVRTFE